MITSATDGRGSTGWATEAAMGPGHSSSVMRQTQATIGVGLLVAGAAGVFPMAMARRPWNRATHEPRTQTGGGCCGGRCE